MPLLLTLNEGELLFASFAGPKKHPEWVFNLRANPEITVESADESYSARIVELSQAEAKRAIQRQAGVSEQFENYVESSAPGDKPVFRIDRV